MEEKVPGGKLARLTVGADARVTLSGDFFIYPEEGLVFIEDMLSGLDSSEPVEAVELALVKLIRERGLELVGIDERVIARLYKGAIRVESHRP